MIAGMIAGAMAGGANAMGQIADNQIQKQTRMDLAKFESDLVGERAAQLARLQQTIGREDALFNTTGDGGKAKLDYARSETGVLADRERQVGEARGDAERGNLVALGGDKAALGGLRAKSLASHVDGVGAAATADAARYDLDRKKGVDKLLDEAAQLRAAGDDAGAERKEREAQTKRGAVPGKSYSDVTGGAQVLVKLADNLLSIEKGGDPNNKANIARANELYQRAADMVDGVADKRGVGKPGGGGGAGGKSGGMPSPAAVKALKENPSLADQFDAKYGKGLSSQFLK